MTHSGKPERSGTAVGSGAGGGTSNSLTFTVTASGTVPPVVTGLSPASVTAGSSGFTLTVGGANFMVNSSVQWNGSARPTNYVSSTQLTAAITEGDVANAGTATVAVVTPGGTSSPATFTITSPASNPVPAIAGLSPASVAAGSSTFTLTVNGTGFVPGSVVQWNGSSRTTAYVSPTQLTASIIASDVASAGAATVTVWNPAPGGGTSAGTSFTINNPGSNPVPAISGLSPTSVAPGSPAFTLTVTGNNFVTASLVRWNGSNRTTTYISSTQLTAAIAAADVAVAGTATVTVSNPTPGGGTSNGASLPIASSGFTLSTLPTQYLIAGAGDPVLATATVIPIGGFQQNVTFSLSGMPAGVSASFSPNPVPPNGSTQISFVAAAETAPGTYNMTLVATGGGSQITQVVTLSILDGTQMWEERLVARDDGSVYAYYASFWVGPDAALVSSRITQASYTSPRGRNWGPASSGWQYGSVPSPIRSETFGLTDSNSGFGMYAFSMRIDFCILFGGCYYFVDPFRLNIVYPLPNISRLSPDSSLPGTLTSVTISGEGLGAPDEGWNVYKGIGSVNVSGSGLTASVSALQSLQPLPPIRSGDTVEMAGNRVAATFDARNAALGTYQVSLTVFGYTTNSLPFTVGDATPYIEAITDEYFRPISTLLPGADKIIILWGTGFGPLPGSVAICSSGASPCSGSDVSAQVTYWSSGQINLLVTTSSASQGPYDLQVASSGASGNGFLTAPGGGNSAQSNRVQLRVYPLAVNQLIPPQPQQITASRLALSTGDTTTTNPPAPAITVYVTPSEITFTPAFSWGLLRNENSACTASPNFTTNSGTGSVNETVTANPAGCSGVFDARAVVGMSTSPTLTQIIVPPQIMVQTAVGEARGQTAPGDDSIPAILLVAKNRFGDNDFPGGATGTWQAVLVPEEFYGARNQAQPGGVATVNGVEPELNYAAQVFAGITTVSIPSGCKAYWSPTNSQFATLQTWSGSAASGITNDMWSSIGAPGLWGNQAKQAVIKSSIANNTRPEHTSAPAFVLFRLAPSGTDPAVITVP